jgi:hypothetical protein
MRKAIVAVTGIAAALSVSTAAYSADPVKIGLILAFSGQFADPSSQAKGAMQLLADLVLGQDEGLDVDRTLGAFDCLQHARKEFLAVLEQFDAIAIAPRPFHSFTSASSGRWSDRCGHGRAARTQADCRLTPRA